MSGTDGGSEVGRTLFSRLLDVNPKGGRLCSNRDCALQGLSRSHGEDSDITQPLSWEQFLWKTEGGATASETGRGDVGLHARRGGSGGQRAPIPASPANTAGSTESGMRTHLERGRGKPAGPGGSGQSGHVSGDAVFQPDQSRWPRITRSSIMMIRELHVKGTLSPSLPLTEIQCLGQSIHQVHCPHGSLGPMSTSPRGEEIGRGRVKQ